MAAFGCCSLVLLLVSISLASSASHKPHPTSKSPSRAAFVSYGSMDEVVDMKGERRVDGLKMHERRL